MSKIFDCFIYNNEFNILSLRLNYLNKFVDYFLIFEFSQTFQGKLKKFNLENSYFLLKNLKKKIIYIKIDSFFINHKDLKYQLLNKNLNIYNKLFSYNHFSHNNFSQCLETTQRLMINEYLVKTLKPNDILIFSDADEIPRISVLSKIIKKIKYQKKLNLCMQNEFRYFLNYFFRSNWPGSIIGLWKNFNSETLVPKIMAKSKDIIRNSFFKVYKIAGYHFSYIGNVKEIEAKILATGHSEINIKYVIKNIDRNVYAGREVSLYTKKTINSKILYNYSSKFWDKKMFKLIFNKENFYPFPLTEVTYYAKIKDILFLFLIRIKKKIIHYQTFY
jgi:beta-1,4-mannosyl-glycoprotein beta-1,4-N-acetylglucosaminyltransferase